jgi:hypothetical protein
MKRLNRKLLGGFFAATLSGLLATHLPAQAEDILFYENFENVAPGELPAVNDVPGGWRTVNPGRPAVVPVTEGGSFLLVEDEENAFGYGTSNQFLRIEGAQAATLATNLPQEAYVVTMSFDYIGRDPGNNARWINIRLNGAWGGTAHIFSIRTQDLYRSIRDGGAAADEPKYGDNHELIRFDVVMNNGGTPVNYTPPGGGTAATLQSGQASVWVDGVQLIAGYNYAGTGTAVGPINAINIAMDSTTISSADIDNFTVFEGAHVLADYDATSGILFQDRFDGSSLSTAEGGKWSTVTQGRSVGVAPPHLEVVEDTENRFGYGPDYKVLRLFRAQNFTMVARPTELVDVMTMSFEIIPGAMADNARWTHFNYLAGGDATDYSTTRRAHITTLRPYAARGENGEWAIDGNGNPTFGVSHERYQIDSILNNSQTEAYTYQDAQGNDRVLPAGRADVWVNGVLIQSAYTYNRNAAGNYGVIRALSILGDSAADSSFDLANFTLLQGGHVLPQIGPDRATGEGYTAWTEFYFPGETSPEIIGAAADPSGDGVRNLIKYALGLNPTIASREGLPVVGFNEFTVGGTPATYLTLTFNAPDDVDDVNFTVRAASEVGAAGVEAVLETAESHENGTTTYTYRDPEPMAENSRRFLSLEVTQAP